MSDQSAPASAIGGGFGGRLTRAASRAWRVVATAIGFGVAGVSSLVLVAVVFPLVRLLPGSRADAQIRNQYALHLAIRTYLRLIVALGVMRVHARGVEILREPGLLVVANHPTLIDALILMSFMPQADCVVKAGHYDNLWLSGTIRAAGYIPNRNGPQLVEDCAARLQCGRSVLIFPEGTRSPRGGLGAFARGAAHIALRSGRAPTPVTIECEPATLYHGLAWYDVPERRFDITLTVGHALSIDEALLQPTSRARAARRITASLRDHFERRLDLARDQSAA